MKKVIVIAGPTASGKTALSIELARMLGGEIVSADSMQIYRGMDIGTAKVDSSERSTVPHHMLDVVSPSEDYSVARYVDEAAVCCEDIISRGRLPIITGGTGLYIDSLLSGRDFAESSDSGLREELGARYELIGGEAMLRELSEFDPERAARLTPGDKRRIVRAIEIYRLTGVSASEHDRQTRLLPPRYDALRIVLSYSDRQRLYNAINTRVDRMVSQGLFDEVSRLLASGIGSSSTAMQAIGYKEPAAAIRGDISQEEAVEQIKLNSRRYAKRQLTWFNRWESTERIFWESLPDLPFALNILSQRGYI